MGDHGFEGAGEFASEDTNFHCNPDSDPREETKKQNVSAETRLKFITQRIDALLDSREKIDEELQKLGKTRQDIALEVAIEACPYRVGQEIKMPAGAFEHTEGKPAVIKAILRGLQDTESKWGVIAEVETQSLETRSWKVPIKWYDIQEGRPEMARCGRVVLPEDQ